MSKTFAEPITSLPLLLQPYNLSYIARELTKRGHKTSRDRIARMAQGKTVPDVRELPALADILRVDVGELASMVAAAAVA